MNGRTHLLAGTALGIALATYWQPLPVMDTVIIAGASMLGSLLPDADHPNARIHRLLIVTRLVPHLSEHRGITHALWVPALIAMGAHYGNLDPLPYYAVLALAIGYLSHILLDMLTVNGVKALYPIKRDYRIAPVRIRTGGLLERGLEIALLVVIVVQCSTMYHNVVQIISFKPQELFR